MWLSDLTPLDRKGVSSGGEQRTDLLSSSLCNDKSLSLRVLHCACFCFILTSVLAQNCWSINHHVPDLPDRSV